MALYRRKSDGPWYADYFDQYSKRTRQSLKTTNKRQAERRLRRILNRVEDIKLGVARPEPPRFLTFGQFADRYLRDHASKKQDGGEVDELRLRLHILPMLGKKPLTGIHRADIAQYQAERAQKAKPATVNRDVQLIKSMYSRAIEWGVAYENPCKGVKLLRENNSRLRVLTYEEEDNLLSAAIESRRPELAPFIVLGLNTALRRGELFRLDWQDVDLEHGHVYVHQSKSGKPRRVPLNRESMQALLDLGPAKSGKLFSFENNVRRTFNHAVKKAGLKDVTPHTLRHTCLSRLAARGVDLVTVQALAGHAQISTTLRYAHLVSTQQAVALLERRDVSSDRRRDLSHTRHKIVSIDAARAKKSS